MSTFTIRPTSFIDKDNSLNGTADSGSTFATATNTQIWTYLGDNSDTTGLRSSGSGSRWFQLGLGTPTIPADEFICRISNFVRYSAGLSGKYVGAQVYKATESVPAGVPSVGTTGSGTLVTTELGYRYSGWENYTPSNLRITVFTDGASTASQRPILWEVGAYVYTMKRATAAPQNVTNTTSTTAVIPVDVTATIDWEASTYTWQNLRKITVEVRVEQGGAAAGSGQLVSTTTKDIYFDTTGTVTTNVTLPDAIANGTYNVYARAIRHRENETSVASDQIGVWSSAATLTMSMSAPEQPSLSAVADQSLDRVAITVTPLRNLMPNPSFEVDLSGWAATRGSGARVTTDYVFGTASAQFTSNATAGGKRIQYGAGANGISVSAGLSYTISAYVKGDATSTGLKSDILASWIDAAGNVIAQPNGPDVTLTTSWQRASITATAPANAAWLNVWIRLGDATDPSYDCGSGKVFYVDAVLVDQSSTLQNYVDAISYTSPYITVERSDDGGTTWTSVRGMTALNASFGVQTVRYDYEAPRGKLVYYRARTSAYVSGVLNTSAATTPQSVTITADGWNLKCPQSPDLNYHAISIIGKPSENVDEDMGVFRPNGRRYPVVVAGTLTGWDGDLDIVTSTDAEWAKVKALVESQAVLYLESPYGWSKYIRLIGGAKTTMEGTATTPRRRIGMSYVQTSSPSGTYLVNQFSSTTEGGAASTASFDATLDGGSATTASFDATADGGVAA